LVSNQKEIFPNSHLLLKRCIFERRRSQCPNMSALLHMSALRNWRIARHMASILCFCHPTHRSCSEASASGHSRAQAIANRRFETLDELQEVQAERLLTASFCDRLIKMGGRLVQPVCAAASCGISDCASRFWKKRVSVHVIIECRVSDLPFAAGLYTLEHQNLCAIRGGR